MLLISLVSSGLFFFIGFAVIIKIASLLMKLRLAWKYSFAASGAAFLIGSAVGFIVGLLPIAPFTVAWVTVQAVGSLSALIVFFGWYFRGRASDANGTPLGTAGAYKLSLLSIVLLPIVGLVFNALTSGLGMVKQPL